MEWSLASRDWEVAFIGLGSNLGRPAEQLRRAMKALVEIPDTHLISHSDFYHSSPLGPAGQPDYINAVAQLETALDPEQLLVELQAIENTQGRIRERHWGPRTLDLDLLLYGSRIIDTPLLKIPHPELHRRTFVLYPLRELVPDLDVPGRGPLEQLLQECPETP